MQKEDCTYGKRTVYVKRDEYNRKEIYTHEKRPIHMKDLYT